MPERKLPTAPACETEESAIFSALESATADLTGMRAICTANAIQNLWNWKGEEDLLKAKANIDYLIKRLGEENASR